ncbi:MAG: DoxX family protein [Chloroflexi bacterium]|nr:DoxX family protein [Chloroflexota bacterium]
MPARFTLYDAVDRRITSFLARHGLTFLRVGLGFMYVWFGALKFFPGLSPAQEIATRTMDRLTLGLIPDPAMMPILATWETLIGLGLIFGVYLRATILLLAVQMVGAVSPLVLFPTEVFTRVPFAPTIEGQYIIKNIVVIGAAMVIGATVRGGRLVAEPGKDPPGSGLTPDASFVQGSA